MPRGLASTLPVMVTSGLLVGTTTDLMSYDAPIVWAVWDVDGSNFPGQGGVEIMVNTSSLGTFDASLSARSAGSACEMTRWMSDSELSCKLMIGLRGTSFLAVTAGILAGTGTEAYSFDAPTLAEVNPKP
ncbi:hypothetical protein T484DRAFT_2101932 [Baffinella frigidus]|nr:hypothetical protein T484DRAFT_2101932 [Cryptophyta sp. CCMP2293]